MRHDFEKAAAETVAAYLEAVLESTLQEAAPVVTFFDPMSLDDASRIVVICESGETKEAGPGNALVQVEVGVKTPWTQPTLSTDVSTHFERVNAVRDAFTVADPSAAVQAYSVSGIDLSHIDSVRRFETVMDRDGAFLYSSIELNCHVNTEENE